LNTANGIQTPQPFTYEEANLGWNFARDRTGLNVGLSYADRDYKSDASLHESSLTLYSRYRRELSARSTLLLSASYASINYEPPGPDYNDLEVDVAFSWRLTQNVTFESKYTLYDRSSHTQPAEYRDNRLWLTISYGRGDPRATRAAPTFQIDPMLTNPAPGD
jgi:hypothetical protein